MRKPESFEKFYYSKVALGEACGCAEKVIDVYEFNHTGGQTVVGRTARTRIRFSWRRFLCKYGLYNRRD